MNIHQRTHTPARGAAPAPRRQALLALLACAFTLPDGHAANSTAVAPALPVAVARAATGATQTAFDGVVEAVRQTVVAAQVPGAITSIEVKAGDRVKAGQILLRIDARAAEQATRASEAQTQAIRASLELARTDLARQQQLFQKNYISQAALERAEAQYKASAAQLNAQLAQTGAARTQSGLHVLRAPYAGVVTELPVTVGDMALPGRPLLTLHDPAQLRVSAAIPQSAVSPRATLDPSAIRVELPGLPSASQWPAVGTVGVLPSVDASTHSVTVRVDLPSGWTGAAPGLFARVWVTDGQRGADGRVIVPLRAVVQRGELTALYVLDGKDQALLRQVRLGRTKGDSVEILSGIAVGERVVTAPELATSAR